MNPATLSHVNTRKLGNTGLEVSPLCLGGNVFGWTIDEPTSFAILDAFVDAGFNFIDTADLYSKWKPGNEGGESETILGNWFARSGKRDKVVIATKIGMEMGPNEKGLSKAYILRGVEESLRRLRTDRIDLDQAHVDDPQTPLEETLSAFDTLVSQGKVRVIGASNYSAARLAEALQVSKAHNYARYQCLQPHYNLYDRAVFENDLEPLCVKEKLGVITYFSLAAGFLTGKYRSEADFSKSARGAGMKKYLNERGDRILKALDEVAASHNATPAQVSLAWLLARPSVTAPIASATNLQQLNQLLDATRLVLDPAAIKQLDQASA
jgi:aryl-alcohol dehydrogenase-like predicted oxidoreductase